MLGEVDLLGSVGLVKPIDFFYLLLTKCSPPKSLDVGAFHVFQWSSPLWLNKGLYESMKHLVVDPFNQVKL